MAFLANKQSYKVPVFDGGLNTKWTDLSMPDHMSPEVKHVEYTNVGAVALAKGYRKLNSSRIATYPIEGLHDYYNATSKAEELLAACHGHIYKVSTGASAFGVVTGGTAAYTYGKELCCRTVEDEVYMTNGYDIPRRYNGSEVLRVNPGTAASYASADIVIGGTMVSTGYYQYLLSAVDENGIESKPVTITTLIHLPGGAYKEMALNDMYIWPASAGVSSKYLYRNTAGVQGIYYRVTALTANQTAYTDNNDDANIVTLADTTYDAPPLCKWWWYHRGRMFAAGDPSNPMRVYYSKAGYPAQWSALDYLDIGKGDGYPITGIRIIGNSLAVHKGSPDGREASIWMIYMPDSTDVTTSSNWYVIKAPAAYAAMGDKGICYMENSIAYLARGGLFVFNGESIVPSPSVAQAGQYASESRSENIDPDIGEWHKDILNNAAITAYDDKLWLAVPGNENSLTNDEIYTYDYSVTTKERGHGAWSKLNDLAINNFAIFDGTLVGGSATDGYIYELDTGYTADGSNLESYYYTATYAGPEKHWDMTKVWRFLWITVSTPGSWNLQVDWWVDRSSTVTGTTNISLTGEGAEWESATFDSSTWDSGSSRRTIRVNLAGCVGKTIQFRFRTNSQDVWWALYRMELEYNLRSRRD